MVSAGVEGWLEEAADGLAAGARVVGGLEHVQLVALDQIFACEQGRGDAALLDQAAEALRVDAQFAGGLHQVEVLIKRGVWHRCVHIVGGNGSTVYTLPRQSRYVKHPRSSA